MLYQSDTKHSSTSNDTSLSETFLSANIALALNTLTLTKMLI